MTPFDEADPVVVAGIVVRDLRVRALLFRDTPRNREGVQRLAPVVWKVCDDRKDQIAGGKITLAALNSYALSTLEVHPDYKDLVGFIPLWMIAGFILKIIIAILIDYWLDRHSFTLR